MNFAHIDADAFFASALVRRRPDLQGKPILALGMGGGCVIAASYEAKATGVKTGMRLGEARKLCPNGIALPSDFSEALIASKQIEGIIKEYCPFVERASVDEWYLDLTSFVGGVPQDPHTWATNLQAEVKRKTSLTVSVGVAPTKLLSKMASEYRKPAGITVIGEPDVRCTITNEAFLQDRPAAAIPGIGRKRETHASAFNWNTAWDVAMADDSIIKQIMGRPGLELKKELNGESIWPVERVKALPKSISRCRSFTKPTDHELVRSHLLDHLTYTVMKMHRDGLACGQVSVWLRDGTYQSLGKDRKLPQPLDNENQLLPYVKDCLDRISDKVPLCTQVGLGLYGLRPRASQQYSLFDDPQKIVEDEQIQEALDTVHEKYGRDIVRRGSALKTTGKKKVGLHVINQVEAKS